MASVQTGPEAHPASSTMVTGSFPAVNRPGRGNDHLPHLTPRLRKEQSYTSSPPSGPSWSVIGRNFTFTFSYCHISPVLSHFIPIHITLYIPFCTTHNGYALSLYQPTQCHRLGLWTPAACRRQIHGRLSCHWSQPNTDGKTALGTVFPHREALKILH